jgi:DNA polymerase III sliding clamp (beta) subunit (PCNA family)
MLNKHNLSIASFTSKEASRYTLNGILVNPDSTVATNDHYLVWVSGNPESTAKDYPHIPGFAGASDTFVPFILGRDAALAIAKVTPSKESIPVLNHVAVSEDGSVMAVTDLDRPQVFPIQPVEGKYPDYAAVIPKFEDAVARISVNAEYLAAIAKQFAGFANDAHKTVTLSFYADSGEKEIDNRPMRFDGTRDGQGMTAMLMPVRGIEDKQGTYGYADREAIRKDKRDADAKAKESEAIDDANADLRTESAV